MSKVMVFIDGQTYYSGWRAVLEESLDIEDLVEFFQEYGELQGVRYYSPTKKNILSFLEAISHKDYITVVSAPERPREIQCHSCSKKVRCANCDVGLRIESNKQLYTMMIRDLLSLDFDDAIIISGDNGLIPIVKFLQQKGKRIRIAAWGDHGLSKQLKMEAMFYIDLERAFA